MTIRIGYVGCCGSESFALGESLRALIPVGCELVLLTIPEALVHVDAGSLTVVIVALDGPSWRESLAMMTELHAVGQSRTAVVLGLVPRDDPAALVKAFDLGVADVTGLPIAPHEFRARLAALVRRRMVAAARAAEMRAAWRLAVVDPLTGLFNRQHLQTVLPAAIDSARAANRPLAVLMADLDSLKPFNDRWGHAAGDRVLRGVADALVANLRCSDTVARLGGDEIAVVMPDTDVITARGIATQLVSKVSSLQLGRDNVRITISVGMATLMELADDAETLLQRADKALYCAKQRGRNQVVEAA